MFFLLFFGQRGGRAGSRLDQSLKNSAGEAALAADLITALPAVLIKSLAESIQFFGSSLRDQNWNFTP